MKIHKWLNTLKQGFDELLFIPLFSKIRKTETNLKRIDRFKKTVAFILFQIVAISLFSFGIAETAQATEDNTTVITARVEDYSRHKTYGRHRKIYFKMHIDGEQYKIGHSRLTVTKEQFEKILSGSPIVTIRVHRGEIAEMYSYGKEYVSLDTYNDSQTNDRTVAITLFSITEIFSGALYVLYIIYHRTSKDKKWI